MIEEEYARNECGIYKIIGKYERRDPYDLCVQLGNFYTGEFEGEQYESKLKIGKLIDLIEVGDYVNGKEVYSQDGKLAVEMAEYMPPYELLENMEIETILTKEQYMQNCYTVERKKEC